MKTLALALLVLFSPLHSQAGMEWKLKKATGSSSGYVRSVVDTTTDGKFSKGFIVYIEKSDTVLFEKDFERDVVTPFSFFIDCYTRNFKSSEDWIMIRFYLVSNDTVYPIQNFDTDGLFVNQWRENGMIADWRFVVGYPPPKHFHKILMCFSSPYATSSSKTTVDIILDNLRADYPNSHGLDSIVVIDRFGDPDPTPSFSVSTKKLDFDSVTVGKVKSLPLVIKNAGDDTLVVMSITSTANDFTIGPVPKKIGPADSASIDVTFKPDSSDLKVGYIIFSHNGSTISDSVLVSGFGKIPLQPALLFSNRVDFGTVSINTVIYKDTVVILRNAGSDTIRGTISVIGNGFSLRDTTLLISPMDSVAKALRFSPEIVGKLTGLLIIRSNNPTSPDTVF